MKHVESFWTSKDNLQIYYQGWEPDTPPRAAICILHGLGEHSGRYAHVGAHFAEHGFALIGCDWHGHGKSEGQRGHFDSLDILLTDFDQLLEQAKQRYPGKPLFLYGHSLGANWALLYAIRRQPTLAGLIATSPGLRTALQDQKLKIAISKALAKIFPRLSIPTGLDAAAISNDPAVVDAYIHDPLVHDRTSFNMAKTGIEAIPWLVENACKLQLPLLIMAGTADKITFISGAQDFASQVQCDCTLKLWEGMAHETHNEPHKKEVLDFMVSWIQSKLS
jgi:alpha-beta hydrolase superfamily lysophospholipase